MRMRSTGPAAEPWSMPSGARWKIRGRRLPGCGRPARAATETDIKLRDGSALTVVSLAAPDAIRMARSGRVWIVRDVAQTGGDPGDEKEGALRALTEQDLAGTPSSIGRHNRLDQSEARKDVRIWRRGDPGTEFADFISAETREEITAAFRNRSGAGHPRRSLPGLSRRTAGSTDVSDNGARVSQRQAGDHRRCARYERAQRDPQALAASEDLYRTLVAALAEGVLMVDADGRLVTCNKAAAQTLGYTQDESEPQQL